MFSGSGRCPVHLHMFPVSCWQLQHFSAPSGSSVPPGSPQTLFHGCPLKLSSQEGGPLYCWPCPHSLQPCWCGDNLCSSGCLLNWWKFHSRKFTGNVSSAALRRHKKRGSTLRLTPDEDEHAPLGSTCKQGSKHVLVTVEETETEIKHQQQVSSLLFKF